MNVLHIGSGNLYGGVEKVLLTLARLQHLCPEIEQHFAVSFRGQLEDELRAAGVPVHSLKTMRGRRPMSVIENRRALARLQTQLSIDTIVYHSLWSYDLLAIAARNGAVSRMLWMHDAFDKRGRLESFARLQRPEMILSNSRYTAQTASIVYPDAKPRVVYYPVEFLPSTRDPRQRQILRASLQTAENEVVIVQSSRMEAWKGQRNHLNALGMLRDLGGWVLWLAGGAQREEEQKYLDSLKRQAESLGILDRIRFLGQRNDVPALLHGADIHCQPNLSPEPFGIAFVEAMMAQLPIATFRLGAAPELIDESCGLLCEPGNVPELASILQLLITNRDLRKRLGSNGPARARHLCDPGPRLHDLYRFLRGAQGAGKTAKAGSSARR